MSSTMKKRGRPIAILLAVFLVLCMFPAGVFANAEDGKAEISLGALTPAAPAEGYAPGETFTVPVLIADNPGFAGIAVNFIYDTDVLEVNGTIAAGTLAAAVSFSGGILSSGSWTKLRSEDINYDGRLSVVAINMGLVTNDPDAVEENGGERNFFGNGKLFQVTFKVKEGAAGGTYELGIQRIANSEHNFTDYDGIPVPANLTGTTFTVQGDQTTPSAQIAVGSPASPIKTGSTFTVPITIEDNPGFAAMALTLGFERDALELLSISGADALLGTDITVNLPLATVGYAGFDDITDDGVLFNATFKAKENAEAGTYALTVGYKDGEANNIVNSEADPLAVEFTAGSAVIKTPEPVILTVYEKENGAADSTRVLKAEYTASQLADLKDATDPVSGMHYRTSMWNIISSNDYVTIPELLKDAGLESDWKSGASLDVVGSGGFKPTKMPTYDITTYDSWFYPELAGGALATNQSAKIHVPAIIALTVQTTVLTSDLTAQQGETYNLAHLVSANSPRLLYGITQEQAQDGSSADGNRYASGVETITLVKAYEPPEPAVLTIKGGDADIALTQSQLEAYTTTVTNWEMGSSIWTSLTGITAEDLLANFVPNSGLVESLTFSDSVGYGANSAIIPVEGAWNTILAWEGYRSGLAGNQITGLRSAVNGGAGNMWVSGVTTMTVTYAEPPELDIDTSWYTANPDAASFEISTKAQLKGLAAIVNGTATVNGFGALSGGISTLDAADPIPMDDFAGQTITLTADIDLEDELWEPIGGATVVSNWTWTNTAISATAKDTALTNVANDANAKPFNGELNGAGKTISNLKIEKGGTVHAIGFIGYLGSSGYVHDLTINGAITSTSTGNAIGGLVGFNKGKISHYTNDVTVTATSMYKVGGIAGFNDGRSGGEPANDGNGEITYSWNRANILGDYHNGGIAGQNAGLIKSCANTGNVDTVVVSGGNGTAGIAGRNGNNYTAAEQGYILDCFSTGHISRPNTRWSGGIAGWNNVISHIENSYFAGTMPSGTTTSDGPYEDQAPIVPRFDNIYATNIINNFSIVGLRSTLSSGGYTVASSGLGYANANEAGNGTVLTDAQMRGGVVFNGKTFVELLNAGANAAYVSDTANINGGYPVLIGVQADAPAPITVDTSWYNTTDTVFNISTKAQLKGFAAIVNGGAVENGTANLIALDNFAGKTVNLTANLDIGGEYWEPIGLNPLSFNGTFDGKGHYISNLTIGGAAYTSGDETTGVHNEGNALFGINRGMIKDVGVTNISVNTFRRGAGIAGYNYGIVSRTMSSGQVSANGGGGDRGTGGIVGTNYGSVVYSYSTATVYNAYRRAGGIVGYNSVSGEYKGVIDSTYFAGYASSASAAYSGSIAATNDGIITNSYWLEGSSFDASACAYGTGTVSASMFTAATVATILTPLGANFSAGETGHPYPYLLWENGGSIPSPTVVSITAAPLSKIIYTVGETLDPAGFTATAHYSDGSLEAVTDISYDKTAALTAADTSVTFTATHGGFTETFEYSITVNAAGLSSIALKVNKTTSAAATPGYFYANAHTLYANGESFDKASLAIEGTFGDGSKRTLEASELSVSPATMVPGTTEVAITATVGSVTKTLAFPVTVLASAAPVLTDGVYQLATADDLAWFAEQVNSAGLSQAEHTSTAPVNAIDISGKLIGDIDLSGAASFKPIGSNNPSVAPKFGGTFDGNEKTVTLALNTTTTYTALFGYVATGGVVKDLTVDGSVTSTQTYAAGIAAVNYGTIENVVNNAAVSGSTAMYAYVGGIAGSSYGTIKDVVNNGDLTLGGQSGGIAGYLAGPIENAENNGNLTAPAIYPASLGGIAGYAGGSGIRNVTNNGNIVALENGASNIGGIAGTQYAPITNAANTGNLNCFDNSIGGIAGSANGTITDAVNTGNVNAQYNVGGIVGAASSGTAISRAQNSGTITATGTGIVITQGAGGIIGLAGSGVAVNSSFNTGIVTGSVMSVGGIAGVLQLTTASVTNSYNLGNVSSTSTAEDAAVGGVVGRSYSSANVVRNTYNAGSVSVSAITTDKGGTIGALRQVGTSILNSYYLDTAVTGGNAFGTPQTSDELKALAPTLGAAFKASASGAYPLLDWQTEAPSYDNTTIIVDTAPGDQGAATVRVPVFVEGNMGFAAGAIQITYDGDALTLVGIDTADSLLSTSITYLSDSYGILTFISTANITANGKLADLIFAVDGDAPVGLSEITLGKLDDNVSNFTDFDAQPVTVDFVGGGIDVHTAVTPTADDLEYDLPQTFVYDTNAHAVTVTPKSGIGAVTVYYNGSAVAPTDADEYTITVDIAASPGYKAVSGLVLDGTLTISKAAAPEITWPTASAIWEGQALSDSNLTSDSDGLGTFAWDDEQATPAYPGGSYAVTFTPSESTLKNYEAITADLTQNVAVAVRVHGDVDGDGAVTVIDAQTILQYLAKLTDLTAEELERVDFDGDGYVTIADAQLVLKKAIE